MSGIDDYVEAVTQRLRADPELHLDVAHEVRAHLEDAAADAREQGLTEEDALERAMKAFGDPEQVSDGLWQANRRRMRARAVARWAARVALVPGLVLLTFMLAATHLTFGARVLSTISTRRGLLRVLTQSPDGLGPRRGLSDEQLFEFRHATCELEDAKALVEHDPDNPALCAHYMVLLTEGWDHLAENPDVRAEALAVLERGKRIDPGNALYNYLKACLLMEESYLKACLLMEESSRLLDKEGISYAYVGRSGSEVVRTAPALAIDNPATFQAAMQEVLEGVRKPYFNSYAGAALDLRTQLMKPPATLAEWMILRAEAAGTLMPHLTWLRRMAERLPAYAALLAAEGRHEQALDVVSVMSAPSIQMGAGAEWLIELLVAQWGLRLSHAQAPEILRTAGRPDLAEQAQKTSEAEGAAWAGLWEGAEDKLQSLDPPKTFGVIGNYLMPVLPFEDLGWILPLREAEHIAFGRGALALVMMMSLLAVLALCAFVALSLVRRRGDARPMLFFVGWRRMALIALVGIVVPMALYWAYTRFSPTSSLRYGINYSWRSAVLELAITASAMLLAVLTMGYHAVRERCREAGMDVPRPGLLNPSADPAGLLLSLVLALAVPAAITVMLAWGADSVWRHALHGILLPGAILLLPFVHLRWQLWRIGKDAGIGHAFRGTYARSLLPVLAASLLAAGIVGGVGLRSAESRRIRAVNTPSRGWALNEMAMTSLTRYRDHLRELDRQWRAGGDAYGLRPGAGAGAASQPQSTSSTSPATMESVAGMRTARPGSL